MADSGEYNALRIDYSAERTIEYSQQSDEIQDVTGSQWLDVLSGKIVKELMTVNIEKTDFVNANTSTIYITRTHVSDVVPDKTVGAARLNKQFQSMKSMSY